MTDKTQKPAHYFNAPREEMLPFIPAEAKRILEVGCGEGYFSAGLKRDRTQHGTDIEITGIELDSECAKKAREHLDQVICANVETQTLDFPDESFDCIICNDVIEHLLTPWDTLEKLRRLLTPSGLIVASIPNVRYWGVVKDLLLNGGWQYSSEGILDITHLRFFTRSSIEEMFKNSGYEIIELSGINSHVRGLKFSILNMLTFGRFEDIQFLQFAVNARKAKP